MVDAGWAGNIDARGYQLKQFKVWQVNGFPSASPSLEGVIAYDTATDRVKICNGTDWVLVATDSDALGGSSKSFFQDLANITNGNLPAARVSGLSAAITGTPLNSLAAPTGAVGFGGQKASGLADGTGSSDAATYGQLMAVANNQIFKHVNAATTGPVTLSGAQTVDSVSVTAGQLVLVKNQAAGEANGIYTVNSGAWTRASDYDSAAEVLPGTVVVVEAGTANGDHLFMLTTNGPITVGTTPLVFSDYGASTGEFVAAGGGLTKTGSTLAVGAGTGITVNNDDVAIDRSSAAKRTAQVVEVTITGASSATVDVTHGLGFQWVGAVVYEDQSGTWAEVGGIGKEPYSTTNMRLFFGATPANDKFKVVFYG